MGMHRIKAGQQRRAPDYQKAAAGLRRDGWAGLGAAPVPVRWYNGGSDRRALGLCLKAERDESGRNVPGTVGKGGRHKTSG